jgi:hypothetical protein
MWRSRSSVLRRHVAADHEDLRIVARGQLGNAQFEPDVTLAAAKTRFDQRGFVRRRGAVQSVAQGCLVDVVRERNQRTTRRIPVQTLGTGACCPDRPAGRDPEHGVTRAFQQTVEQRRRRQVRRRRMGSCGRWGQHGRSGLSFRGMFTPCRYHLVIRAGQQTRDESITEKFRTASE